MPTSDAWLDIQDAETVQAEDHKSYKRIKQNLELKSQWQADLFIFLPK